LVTGVVFIALFTMAIRYPADSDTWWHLRAGQTMAETKTILTTDIFSHTKAGSAWINHSWLAQLFWYGLSALGGWPGLGLGLALIVTAAFWLVWQQSEGNLYVKAFAIILGAIASSLVWAARPQMVSFFFAALVAFLLNRFKRGGGTLLPWLPLIVLVWVNSHGGFAIAFILLICYGMGEAFNALTRRPGKDTQTLSRSAWKQLLLTTLICLAVVAVNPYTWQMWLYPFRTVGIGVLRDFIAEWQSPDFHQPIVQPFLAMLLLLLASIARSNRKVDWTDLALVGGWTTLSLFAVRNVAIFAVVCTPVLIRYASLALEAQFGPLTIGRKRRLSRPFYLFNWGLLILIILGAIGQTVTTLSPAAIEKAEAERFPAEAVAFIQQTQPPGPIFNSYNIGGYLMYQLWPDYPVFVDGRTDLYDDDFLRTYLQTVNALPGWQTHLDQYSIKMIVTEKHIPLAFTLQNEPDWDKIFEDDQTLIFVQRNEN
jgi:hypothetical protein